MFTKKNVTGVLAAAAACVVVSTASAGFVVEDAPAWRGDANTLYGGWEDWTNAGANYAPNYAQSGNMGPFGTIYNFSGTAFATSTNNLYDATNPLNMHHYVQDVAGDITDAVFNVSTAGSGINMDSVIFQWTATDGTSGYLNTDANVNFYQEIPNFGVTQNLSWVYDLSGIDAQVTSIGLIFQAAGPHMSYDAAAIDVRYAAIPAPGALALIGLAGVAGRRRRRRN